MNKSKRQVSAPSKNPFKVVIVGGGAAGWMTAAYLHKALEKKIDIRLIESEDIGTIGVGEATFSDIHFFLDFLGLEEEDWMPECNATYKLCVRFVDWNAQGQSFDHPFQRLEVVRGQNLADWWLKCKRARSRFDYDLFVVPSLCDTKRSPRFMDGTVYCPKAEDYFSMEAKHRVVSLDEKQVQHPYAYHFDAKLFAQFLSRYAQQRGVRRIVDDVEGVELAKNGYIRALKTKKNGLLEGDLFIDCTGFRGLLINQTLKEPFISFGDNLLCDRAVAMPTRSDPANKGIKPYTTATAITAGWVWNTPLFNRDGNGYVYSSAFLSPDEAEKEFRKFLGRRADDGQRALHIKMRVGRNRRAWVKNCVAIGLAGSFVEPLESTGIFFIQHAIERLVSHFPSRGFDEVTINGYNKAIADCVDGIRDFLVLHYVASSRKDTPFWKATKNEIKVPDDLAERLKLWKARLPTKLTINPNYHGFEAYSYIVMLLGLGWFPASSLAVLDHMPVDSALEMFGKVRQRSRHLCSSLPSQYEYLATQHRKSMDTDDAESSRDMANAGDPTKN